MINFNSISYFFFDNLFYLISGLTVQMFMIGLWALFSVRKNIIMLLMAVEMVLLAVNLNFVIFSLILDDITGQGIVVCILVSAAADAALGLALLLVIYRVRGMISINMINTLKG